VTSDYQTLEQLLADFVAAKEVGLLIEGPTPAERRRLAVEMGRPVGVRKGVAAVRPWSRRARLLAGLAVLLALAAGLSGLSGRRVPPDASGDHEAARGPDPSGRPSAAFLDGRGRLLAVEEETRWALLDAARGRVRLDRGELFVELPPDADLRADIETPAATATAVGTSFCVRYGETLAGDRRPFLTVVVLGGFVTVRNAHGWALGGAGEVVLADGGSAPRRLSGAPPRARGAPPEQGWWRFGNVLGLLHRPEVLAELRLTEGQKARLRPPAGEDCREVRRFFGDLYSVSAEERPRKAAEFRAAQEKRLAEVLDGDQQRRLGQILLQQQGYAALASPDVADLLRLSAEQRRQVEAVTRELGQARRAAFSWGPWGGPDFGRRLDEVRQREAERLAALLTEEQKERWRSLTGRPFQLEPRAGDWRDWWDAGNWMDGREPWRVPENWRGPWGPGGWRDRRPGR
jgi:ferric-dicitrate binding protein FerR (iron transport regulator)